MRCELCPRRCGAERTERIGAGRCAMPAAPVVARAALHRWEEPCISGTRGSGTVFFSGCPLGCVFCQNGRISHENFGKTVTAARLREIFFELAAQGAHNINLVNPTHFTPWVLEAMQDAPNIPFVWNSGGYERVETLRALEGRVQIYLPDMKYADSALAREYSDAEDYFEVAAAAIREMFRQVGPYRMGEGGILASGVVVRHLMLPGALENTRRVIDWFSQTFKPGEVLFSLMNQYTPQEGAQGVLRRRVSGAEYRAAAAYMENCGIRDGFLQDASSAQAQYTPDFNLQGI